MTMFPSTWPHNLVERAYNQYLICAEIGHEEADILHYLIENNGPFNTVGNLLDKLFDMEDQRFNSDSDNVVIIIDEDDAAKADDDDNDVIAKNSSVVDHDDTPKADNDDVSTINSSFSKLALETLTLIQASKCRICREKPRTVVLLPCSELMLCIDCSKTAKTCPQCKETIELTINTFMC